VPGPLPNPPDQRRRRNGTSFTGVELPASGRTGPAPKLPNWRRWDPKTRRWWKELWASPQATQWDPSGMSLWVYAALMDMLITEEHPAHRLSPELRAWEDRHGLSPKAMASLRWRIADAEPSDERPKGRYRHLKAIDPALDDYSHLRAEAGTMAWDEDKRRQPSGSRVNDPKNTKRAPQPTGTGNEATAHIANGLAGDTSPQAGRDRLRLADWRGDDPEADRLLEAVEGGEDFGGTITGAQRIALGLYGENRRKVEEARRRLGGDAA
jgi:hypothetical protein